MSDPSPPLAIPSKQPPSPWPRRVILGLLVLGAVGAAGWFALQPQEEEAGPVFRTTPVETREIVQTVESSGALRARGAIAVTAGVNSRLLEILVKPRQRVKAGDPLARLDAAALGLQTRQAEAALSAAGGAINKARAAKKLSAEQLARVGRLSKAGQASRSALQAAQSESSAASASLTVAQARWREAKAAVELARFSQTQTTLRAPKDGVVLQVPEQLGLAVSPAGPVLFSLSEPLSELTLVAAVAEADIGQLSVDQAASFEVQAYPGRRFPAKVRSIGLVANKGSRGITSYPVELSADNPDGALLPGMSAELRFEIDRAKSALAVRDAALRFRPEASEAAPRSVVYVVDPSGALRRVPVEAGVTDGVWTQVKGQLSEGDQVAVGFVSSEASQRPGLKIGG